MQVVRWCQSEGVDLVVVGPEAPLVAGLVDILQAAGIRSPSPSQPASRQLGRPDSEAGREFKPCHQSLSHSWCTACSSPDYARSDQFVTSSFSIAMQRAPQADAADAECMCRAFGPSASAARLEGSKAFLKVAADHSCRPCPAHQLSSLAAVMYPTIVQSPGCSARQRSSSAVLLAQLRSVRVQDLCAKHKIPTAACETFRQARALSSPMFPSAA